MSPTQLVSKDADRKGIFKRSMLAVAVMALTPLAFAQDNSEADESVESDDIVDQGETVVTGQFIDLQDAQQTKRNADTFVDSIDAENIGSLPDRSVLEAMQRIPGVSIERFAAKDDPDRFSTEGSGAVVRGLTFTRSEFNGRDSFTANSGRGLNFSDVSPELISGVDVFKNQTADMVEGGIAGTISLKTRKPFDQSGRKVYISADTTYGDLREEATPTFSGLFSDTFNTDIGEFGFLVSYANSELRARSEGVQLAPPILADIGDSSITYGNGLGQINQGVGVLTDSDRSNDGIPTISDEERQNRIRAREGVNANSAYLDNLNEFVDASSDIASVEQRNAINREDVDVLGDPNGDIYDQIWIPRGASALLKEDDRSRQGVSAVLQWRDPSETIEATLEYIRSDARTITNENVFGARGPEEDQDVTNLAGTQFEVDDLGENEFDLREGRVRRGILTQDGSVGLAASDTWRGGDNVNYRIPFEENVEWCGPGTEANGRPGGAGCINSQQFGITTQSDTRYTTTENTVEDFSFNLKWNPTDALSVSTDIQYVDAEVRNDDVTLMLGTHANIGIDATGDTPTISFSEPWAGQRTPGSPNYNDGDPSDPRNGPGNQTPPLSQPWNTLPGAQDGDRNYFQDRTSYYWRSAMDHYERSEGELFAGRIDAKYEFEDLGLLRSISAGVRYSNRQQDVRSSQYNWGGLTPQDFSNVPNGGFLDQEPEFADDVQVIDLNRHLRRSGVVNIAGDGTVLAPSREIVQDYANWIERLRPLRRDSYVPAELRDEGTFNTNGTFFLPGEQYFTEEDNTALYARVDFGSDDYRFRFSGNIGLRYVEIDQLKRGASTFENILRGNRGGQLRTIDARYQSQAEIEADPNSPDDAVVGSEIPNGGQVTILTADPLEEGNISPLDERGFLLLEAAAGGQVEQDLLDFANGSFVPRVQEDTYDYFLPSFNLKVELTDDLIGRLAISRAIALPDISDIRNSQRVRFDRPTVNRANGGEATAVTYQGNAELANADGTGTGETYIVAENSQPVTALTLQPLGENQGIFESEGGNPNLVPMESDQIDLSLEWYFADVGSLTTSLFYKDLKNIFARTNAPAAVLNETSGSSQVLPLERSTNAGDGELFGFELAYQQTYSMLPEPWDGLGMQANYTYIDAGGSPSVDAFNSPPIDSNQPIRLRNLALEGQSQDTVNFQLFYRKDKIDARVAYNWRSDYLLTTQDVITGLPTFVESNAFMDASIFYQLTDAVRVGLQGTNLLDTQTDTYVQVNDSGRRDVRSSFIQDRRYSLIMRASF